MFGARGCLSARNVMLTAFWVLSAFCAIPSAGDTQSPGIRIQLNREKHLSLRISLMSNAKTTVKVSRNRLPWEAGDSLMVVTARANGQCLKRSVIVNDPLFDEISVEPNTALSGNVDLEEIFPDLRRLSDISDVQLFWAYEAPEALHTPHWSGGWLLIPQQK